MSSSQRFSNSATPRQSLNIQRGKAAVKAVGSFVPQLTRKAFEKFGFSAATLIMDWPAIVGGDIAYFTQPERLKWPRLAGDSNAEGTQEPRGRQAVALAQWREEPAPGRRSSGTHGTCPRRVRTTSSATASTLSGNGRPGSSMSS